MQVLKNVRSYRCYRAKNAQAQKDDEARGGRIIQEHMRAEAPLKSVPDVETPLVRTHPVIKHKGLIINEARVRGTLNPE